MKSGRTHENEHGRREETSLQIREIPSALVQGKGAPINQGLSQSDR